MAKEKAKKATKAKKVAKEVDLLDEDETVESLDSILKRLAVSAKEEDGTIEQAEIDEETAQFDLTDEDLEHIMDFFKKEGIKVVSNSDEELELELDDIDSFFLKEVDDVF